MSHFGFFIRRLPVNFRHAPLATASRCNTSFRANFGISEAYSTTSSAKADTDGGMVSCSSLAVCILIRNDR